MPPLVAAPERAGAAGAAGAAGSAAAEDPDQTAVELLIAYDGQWRPAGRWTYADTSWPAQVAPAAATLMRLHTDLAVCAGIGVSSAAQAATVAGFADGVIVGTALVRRLGEDGVEGVRALTADLASAIRGARARRPAGRDGA